MIKIVTFSQLTVTIEDKLESGIEIQELTSEDIQQVYDEVKDTNNTRINYLKACFHIGFFCKKDRKMKLIERMATRFEENLDIRSFVSVNTNMALTLNMLFTYEQLVLFKHHFARTIPKYAE